MRGAIVVIAARRVSISHVRPSLQAARRALINRVRPGLLSARRHRTGARLRLDPIIDAPRRFGQTVVVPLRLGPIRCVRKPNQRSGKTCVGILRVSADTPPDLVPDRTTRIARNGLAIAMHIRAPIGVRGMATLCPDCPAIATVISITEPRTSSLIISGTGHTAAGLSLWRHHSVWLFRLCQVLTRVS